MLRTIKLLLFSSFFLFNTFFLFSQNKLTIVIEGLKNNDAVVLLELKDSNGLSVITTSGKIENKTCKIIISDLKQGAYSFKYFHDQNNNKKLDQNIVGMPTEGFGFSNNAKGRFGPPDFKKTIFSVNEDTTLKCYIIYL